MMARLLFLLSVFNFLAPINSWSATRAIMEGVAATSNTIFIDTTNVRVGIGKIGPTTALDVSGVVTATSYAGSGASLTGVITSSVPYVPLAGGTMTGQLTLAGSTLTVTGPLGVNVTYGVTAGTFTGNGAALTSLTAANISAGSLGASVMASSVAVGAFYSADPIRANLGLAIGTNVQAWDTDLDKLATKDGSDLLKISSVAVNAVYPAAVSAGTYSNITLPAANVAAGTLSAGVLIPAAGVDLSTVTTAIGLKVSKAGDTITGDLYITGVGTALSVQGTGGLNVSYGVYAGTVTALSGITTNGIYNTGTSTATIYYGSGAGLTSIPNAALVTPVIPSSATGTYPLSISGTATEATHATTASNVTTNANLTGPVTSVGNATTIVGPIPVSTIDLSTVTANHVLKTGDTMTGPLTVSSLTVTGQTGIKSLRETISSTTISGTAVTIVCSSGTSNFVNILTTTTITVDSCASGESVSFAVKMGTTPAQGVTLTVPNARYRTATAYSASTTPAHIDIISCSFFGADAICTYDKDYY